MREEEALRYLLRLSRAMTANLDLGTVLGMVIEHSVRLTAGQAGVIALRGGDGRLRAQASYGMPLAAAASVLALDEVLAHQERQWQWSGTDEPRLLQVVSSVTGLPVQRMVSLPLTAERELLGVALVLRPSVPFAAAELELLEAFAAQAAIAVRNASLYAQVAGERARLQVVMSHSVDGIMILYPDLTVMELNPAAERLAGVSRDSALRQPINEVLRLTGEDGAVMYLAEPPERTVSVQARLLGPNGATDVDVTYVPVCDDAGECSAYVVNLRDVSRYREADRLKTTFISAVSHELKTPVALIKGYAETLARPDVVWEPSVVRESAQVIVDESDRLARQIGNLLQASLVEAGALPLHPIVTSLAEIAEQVVRAARVRDGEREFILSFPAGYPECFGDPERLREVFENLVENATKYSPPGTPVEVGGYTRGRYCLAYVSDHGSGVPVDKRDAIFERFLRLRSSAGRVPGTGLGLFLARAIVEAHGGRIWVEDAPGGGARFVFALPAHRGDTRG